MVLRILRCLLVLSVLLGVALPKSSAVLAEVIGAQTVVICTGTGLEVLVLDANGTPIERQSAPAHHCLLHHATDTAVAPNIPQRGVTYQTARHALRGPVHWQASRPLYDGVARAPPISA
ncbi:hypothetical protein BFP70_11140 [Thioclava sp. SK-1]|uniref:hypothetical protein n=1 Tax=Thioclava sp. SK-1 TaxID=1889770 RepID=UPI000826D4D5|nr:hypothetical protein [Thioclava sp. SK-1]OCX64579.1 hypothetical protein BFP70_11140 [Thioclava sp. SK-1]